MERMAERSKEKMLRLAKKSTKNVGYWKGGRAG
jgi:hypothetical protein